uniref:RING-type E3 ubiquitin-protein ligase PPIL2 n=1 Tax=Setaria digitata TaxID=48799 RepID=A0A915Q8C6_9BILA
MGKKQHQKDKLYLTTTEWKETYGGHKDDTGRRMQRALFKRLPITHCALSLRPFEDPVCSQDGIIFDLTQIIPYLKRFGVNPVTGKKMTAKELIHLKFDKDSDGESNFRCPVTFRVFTPTSHVVAIRQTGNVYALEAVEELNLKPGHLRDLLTDEQFQRKDIITLQAYLIYLSKIEAEKKAMEDPKFYIRQMNNETKEILEKLAKEYVPAKIEDVEEQTADELNAAHYSQGLVAAGLTSTTMEPVTQQKAAVLDAETVKYKRVKKNGYARIVTNFGAINLELYCKEAPRACENFITHCKNGYYNSTRFHRVIRNFMMQGGDPTGTGKGGDSIWGKPFKDEILPSFSHDQRGVLSMANHGTDTNKSQFFITFRSCNYLDGKHTIFGRVVGGTGTLNTIEKIETDEKNRPIAKIFVDPFEEAEVIMEKERENIRLAKANKSGENLAYPSLKKFLGSLQREAVSSPATAVTQIPKPKKYGTGVGKYINLPEVAAVAKRAANDAVQFCAAKKTVMPNQVFILLLLHALHVYAFNQNVKSHCAQGISEEKPMASSTVDTITLATWNSYIVI